MSGTNPFDGSSVCSDQVAWTLPERSSGVGDLIQLLDEGQRRFSEGGHRQEGRRLDAAGGTDGRPDLADRGASETRTSEGYGVSSNLEARNTFTMQTGDPPRAEQELRLEPSGRGDWDERREGDLGFGAPGYRQMDDTYNRRVSGNPFKGPERVRDTVGYNPGVGLQTPVWDWVDEHERNEMMNRPSGWPEEGVKGRSHRQEGHWCNTRGNNSPSGTGGGMLRNGLERWGLSCHPGEGVPGRPGYVGYPPGSMMDNKVPLETKFAEKPPDKVVTYAPPFPEYRPQVNRVTAPTYDGSTPWEDYVVQFELISELNGWAEQTKALQLAASLRGPAQAVLSDLESAKRRVFHCVVGALEQRFGQANQTELFRTLLRNRSRQPGETVSELAHDTQRLLSRAYPHASVEMKETLAREFFIDAVGDSDFRWKIYQARPKTFNEAVSIAVELEAFALSEQKRGNIKRVRAVGERTGSVKEDESLKGMSEVLSNAVSKGFAELTENLTKLLRKDTRNNLYEGKRKNKTITCWNCGEVGHVSRDCTNSRKEEASKGTELQKENC